VTHAFQSPRRTLAVAVGYLVVLAAGVWILAAVVGRPIAGTDAAGWLAPVMTLAAVAGWFAVLLRLPAGAVASARFLYPALGAGAAFLLAGLVLHGLGSGDPLKGPALALAQFGHPSFYLAVVLAFLATAVVSMGSSPHHKQPARPIG
jgi:hypothetical protein